MSSLTILSTCGIIPPLSYPMKNLSSTARRQLEIIARLFSEGYDFENVARRADLDVPELSHIISTIEFESIFNTIDPEAYAVWKQARASELSKRKVIAAAREDAPEHYQMLRDIVRDPKSGLRPPERAAYLKELIKMSKVLDNPDTDETVSMAPVQLEAMQRANSAIELPYSIEEYIKELESTDPNGSG